ncbi:MAG: hypothetical protein GY720_04585 [bacterium]|nr:hypothetical protein [bacterium]
MTVFLSIEGKPFFAGTSSGRATAYVCEGFVCRQPTTSADELADQLATPEMH